MSKPGTFYVLGAGTSAGVVPFTGDILALVRQRYVDLGVYSTTNPQSSPLLDRLVLEPMYDAWAQGEGHPDDILVEKVPLSTLELIAQKAWSPRLSSTAPPQYSLLQRVARPAVFFTFNLDGLAKAYLRRRHTVLEPHGTVDRLWTEDPAFDELLEWSLDIRLPSISAKTLPGPEPTLITSTRPYREARRYLLTAPAVVIVGYSFGTFRGKMDDSESFEYLLDILDKRLCPIFVVDPHPDPLATVIEERLRCRCVIPVPLRWDDFSWALIDSARAGTGPAAFAGDRQLNSLIAAYELRSKETGEISPASPTVADSRRR
jgi:hypothetical protein